MNTVTDKLAAYRQITDDCKRVFFELTNEMSKHVWKNNKGYWICSKPYGSIREVNLSSLEITLALVDIPPKFSLRSHQYNLRIGYDYHWIGSRNISQFVQTYEEVPVQTLLDMNKAWHNTIKDAIFDNDRKIVSL